jgi:hypothetical protein
VFYDLIKEYKKPFLISFSFYWAIFLIGLAYSLINPEPGSQIGREAGQSVGTTFPKLADAYTQGNFLTAFILTFLVNFVFAAMLYIALPSLLFPLPLITCGSRALLWGLLFVPAFPIQMWPHYVTVFLEGMGYIIALTASFGFGVALFSLKSRGKRKIAYLQALKNAGKIYIVSAIVLLIAAAYEAFEVTYLL